MQISLVMTTADGDERVFPVTQRAVIGRNSRSDIRIALPSVSDRHCQLTVINGQLHVEDLESQIGTFHNGNRVHQAELIDQDTLTIGPVTFRIRYQPAATEEVDVLLKPVKPVSEMLEKAAQVQQSTLLSNPAPPPTIIARGDSTGIAE